MNKDVTQFWIYTCTRYFTLPHSFQVLIFSIITEETNCIVQIYWQMYNFVAIYPDDIVGGKQDYPRKIAKVNVTQKFLWTCQLQTQQHGMLYTCVHTVNNMVYTTVVHTTRIFYTNCGQQEEPAILISRLLLCMHCMYVASIRLAAT